MSDYFQSIMIVNKLWKSFYVSRLDSIDTDDMISLDSPVAAEYRENIEEHSLLAEIYNELSTTTI